MTDWSEYLISARKALANAEAAAVLHKWDVMFVEALRAHQACLSLCEVARKQNDD